MASTVHIPHSIKLFFQLPVFLSRLEEKNKRRRRLCHFRQGSVVKAPPPVKGGSVVAEFGRPGGGGRDDGELKEKHTYLLSASALHFGDSSSKDLVNFTT